MGELIDALAVALKAGLGFQAVFLALLAVGLNIQFGYTGLLNFGQIAFAMLGGYGIAISVSKWGLNFWVGVAIGILAAVVLALLLGLPTLRLRARSEEHTSELQSRQYLVCRLLLEKKTTNRTVK